MSSNSEPSRKTTTPSGRRLNSPPLSYSEPNGNMTSQKIISFGFFVHRAQGLQSIQVKHYITKKQKKIMKRIVLLLVGTLLTTWATDAQLLRFGARVGIGTGSYEFDSVMIEGGTLEPAGDRVSGYQAGLFMRLSLPTLLYKSYTRHYQGNTSRRHIPNHFWSLSLRN